MDHLSLLELNEIIKSTLSTNLEPSYWIVAEIGDIRINQRGHCYMDLVEKEDDALLAKIKGIIWAYTYQNLSTWFHSITGKELQPGMKILANVQVQFHELFGLSLNVRDIDPRFTLGERARKRQEVVNRLQEEGVLDMNKQLSLPLVPQRIAVISSPTAAGFEDFIKQLEQNAYGYEFDIRLFKTIMQGEEAIESLTQSLERINALSDQFDLLAIIRGGGSQVDLDCFDHYDIAMRAAQFPIPVITGIGHERDETITDLVAHSKMKTPTAVAEFLISGFVIFEQQLFEHQQRMVELSRNFLTIQESLLDNYMIRMRSHVGNQLISQEGRLNVLKNQVVSQSRNFLEKQSIQLDHFVDTIRNLSPDTILERGYTISTIDGIIVKKVQSIKEGQILVTQTKERKLESIIKTVSDDE